LRKIRGVQGSVEMITVGLSLINCMRRGSAITFVRALGKRRMEEINIKGEEKPIDKEC